MAMEESVMEGKERNEGTRIGIEIDCYSYRLVFLLAKFGTRVAFLFD